MIHLHLPFFDANECKEIISYIEEKQIFLQKKYDSNLVRTNEVDAVTNAAQRSSIFENLSTRLHEKYNFFNDNPKYIPRLKKILLKNYPQLKYPLFVQCWGNFYQKGQGISWHTHSIFGDSVQNSGLTSNIFIGGDEDIGITYAFHDEDIPKYNYINVKNKTGYIQFVSNKTYHMVSPNKSDQKRYTLGMTITEYDFRYSNLFFHLLAENKDMERLLVIQKPDTSKTSFNYA